LKGEEKIDHWVWTIHGDMPVCKCGSFLFSIEVNGTSEWICIKCEPEKLKREVKTLC